MKVTVFDDTDLIKRSQSEADGDQSQRAESKETSSTNSSSERGSVLSNFVQNWNDPPNQVPKVSLVRAGGDQESQDPQAGEFLSLKKIEKPTLFKIEQNAISTEPQMAKEEERQTKVRFTLYLDDQGVRKAGGRAKLKAPKKGILKRTGLPLYYSETPLKPKTTTSQPMEDPKPTTNLTERVIDVILRDSRTKLVTAKTSSHFEEVWRSFKNSSVRQLWSLLVLNPAKLSELYRSRAIEYEQLWQMLPITL